jgi:hypothetical protein
MNACAHMVACLAGQADEGAKNSNQLRSARRAALEAGLACADFLESRTQETQAGQMERAARLKDEELDYWGIAVFGRRADLDPSTKKFSVWHP